MAYDGPLALGMVFDFEPGHKHRYERMTITRMQEDGYITQAARDKALKEPIKLISSKPREKIAPYFTDLPPAILEAACTRYKALGIWGKDPILPRSGYDRLRDGLISGGFVSPGATFEQAVDNSLAEEVLAGR